jgi:SsrA-binding protein
MASKLNIKNKKARFEFEILETFVAGMELMGSEIKSIRAGKAHITESFCQFKKNELYIVNMYIDEFSQASYTGHDMRRVRKLLMKRQELNKLMKKVNTKGLTIIPLKVFISSNGFAKIDIALAQGKKIHDKRSTIKDRDLKRELDRSLK